jgi:hypothetical protein
MSVKTIAIEITHHAGTSPLYSTELPASKIKEKLNTDFE